MIARKLPEKHKYKFVGNSNMSDTKYDWLTADTNKPSSGKSSSGKSCVPSDTATAQPDVQQSCQADISDAGLLYRATIKLPPRTKKNSQRIMTRKNGKPFIMPSKDYTQYEKSAFWDLSIPEQPIDMPCCVKCLYYMPTRRQTDLTNLLEATDDLLVHAGVLADDNSKILVSHDGSRVLYDKENPRTEIWIMPVSDDEEAENSMYKCSVKK